MEEIRLSTCMLCEAVCGLEVKVEHGRVTRVTGDRDDPFSRGHICPKAAALEDIRLDPDRVTRPLRRGRDGFEPVSWDDALREAADRLGEIQERHGSDAVGLYLGNPNAHSYTGLFGAMVLYDALGTRARFSATSVDQLPQMLAALTMLGHQALLAVPDVDRTSYLLVVGANPLVSNGSVMTAPGIEARLEALRARGGKLVVVDPRRTETARVADRHLFIRPGTDALFLLGVLHTLFAEKRTRLGRLEPMVRRMRQLEAAAAGYAPEAVAPVTGIPAEDIREVARGFAAADGAACYVRVGACTQEFGGLVAWLALALDVVTGNLDRAGGKMFGNGPVDVVKLATLLSQKGHFDRYRSRVRDLPEFGGELPAVTMAEEIETSGEGQLRGLVTIAGNPVLSVPNGARLEKALPTLDFMVSVDIYKNETTRHASIILPTTFGMERDHFDLILYAVAVRAAARWAPALFPPAGETRHDWDILVDLASRIAARGKTARRWSRRPALLALKALGPRRALDLLLRAGPHRMSLQDLERAPHGLDLGELVPKLPGALCTDDRKIDVAPQVYLDDLPRLAERMTKAQNGALELIGRRSLRSNNSWMHNSQRLVKGKEDYALLMHPEDARARGLSPGQRVKVRSRVGEVIAPLVITGDIARGVVSLPHGWGHTREGIDLRVARAHAGASINDVTDELLIDRLSGTASLSGVEVEVSAA